jgi:swainsonine biosynthesis dioxygenase SwnH1/2
MSPGSALLFLGSAYHGGGHNSTDAFRTVYGLFFCRGTLRQEENQFLAVPHSTVMKMTPGMQALLGYKKPNTVLGIVGNSDPMADLGGVLGRVAS